MNQIDWDAELLLLMVTMLIPGAIGGAIGVLVKEGKGRFELPGTGVKYVDLGWIADVVIGAVAAAAAVAIAGPTSTVATIKDGVESSVQHYSAFQTAGLALIIGSVGGAAMAAFQTRYLTGLTKDAARDSLQELKDAVEKDAKQDVLLPIVTKAQLAVEKLGTTGGQ